MQYAVIGRIPGDPEDTCLVFDATDAQEAERLFEEWLYETAGVTQAEIMEEWGETLFVTFIVAGDHLRVYSP